MPDRHHPVLPTLDEFSGMTDRPAVTPVTEDPAAETAAPAAEKESRTLVNDHFQVY